MKQLPNWVLTDKNPAFYDSESKTAIEQTARLYGAMQELISESNENFAKIPVEIEDKVQEHIENGAFDSQIKEMTKEVLDEVDSFGNDVSLLDSRLNTLLGSVKEGNTTLDAELLDIRTGHDGFVHANAGNSVRDQIGVSISHQVVSADNIKLKFDFNTKTVKLYAVDPSQTVLIMGEKGYFNRAGGEFEDITVDISGLSGTHSVVFNRAKYTLSLHPIKGNANTGEERREYGDIVLCIAYFKNSNMNHVISGCPDLIEVVGNQNPNYYGYATPAIAIYQTGLDINIDMTNKSVVINSGTMWFDHGSYYQYSNTGNSVSFDDVDFTSGKSLCVVLYRNKLKLVDVLRDMWNPHYKTIFTMWIGAGCNLKGIIAHANILKGVNVNGVPYEVEASTKVGNKTTAKIFKKVVCVGDSYTSGHITDASGTAHPTNEDYAWPHYMATATGNEWVNCGSSGANVLTWQTAERGLAKAQTSGKAQAYVIGLMINDTAQDTGRYVTLGTPSDIGTNAQTYYGGLSQIITKLATISPNAKIFVCTCPRTGGLYPSYNQAVKDVVAYYQNTLSIHCLDLLANLPLYQNESLTDDLLNGHYTASGYEQFAEIMMEVMSSYINDNIALFQDVAFIEYD